jgi:dTDP-4-dehydro-6-deoxy-alpha-D-glucopyranose 2,3-dehydratase
MAGSDHLKAFRDALSRSRTTESADPAPLLDWLEARRAVAPFTAELIPLREARGWHTDPDTGDVMHESGQFFGVAGVRTTSTNLREVNSWDQPIFTQKEGGILALLARESSGRIQFLLAAKAEPGNIGRLQFAPTIQATWSNLRRAHKGSRPRYAEIVLEEVPSTLVYRAQHNEEGGRFWQKSNSNVVHLIDETRTPLEVDGDHFAWATLSQVKALCLIDNIVNPYVKTIIAPL